jgi:hypothetical protein
MHGLKIWLFSSRVKNNILLTRCARSQNMKESLENRRSKRRNRQNFVGKPPQPWIKQYDKHLESRDLCQIMPSDTARPRVIVWQKSLLLGVYPIRKLLKIDYYYYAVTTVNGLFCNPAHLLSYQPSVSDHIIKLAQIGRQVKIKQDRGAKTARVCEPIFGPMDWVAGRTYFAFFILERRPTLSHLNKRFLTYVNYNSFLYVIINSVILIYSVSRYEIWPWCIFCKRCFLLYPLFAER